MRSHAGRSLAAREHGRGITIGPDLWRAIYKPHYQPLFTEWHKITRMKVNLHTCGCMRAILPDLVECGADLYNPVQVSANGMEPAGLKARLGGRLIFYGGAFDSVSLPVSASPDAVYEAVKANIRALSRGGGHLRGRAQSAREPARRTPGAMLRAYRDCRYDADCRRT